MMTVFTVFSLFTNLYSLSNAAYDSKSSTIASVADGTSITASVNIPPTTAPIVDEKTVPVKSPEFSAELPNLNGARKKVDVARGNKTSRKGRNPVKHYSALARALKECEENNENKMPPKKALNPVTHYRELSQALKDVDNMHISPTKKKTDIHGDSHKDAGSNTPTLQESEDISKADGLQIYLPPMTDPAKFQGLSGSHDVCQSPNVLVNTNTQKVCCDFNSMETTNSVPMTKIKKCKRRRRHSSSSSSSQSSFDSDSESSSGSSSSGSSSSSTSSGSSSPSSSESSSEGEAAIKSKSNRQRRRRGNKQHEEVRKVMVVYQNFCNHFELLTVKTYLQKFFLNSILSRTDLYIDQTWSKALSEKCHT